MLPTPETNHLRGAEYADSVYEPAEDSYILLDALELDATRLVAARPRLILEVG